MTLYKFLAVALGMDGKGRSKENHLEMVDSEAQKVMAEDISNAMKLSSASSDVSTDSISKVQMR